MRIGLDLDDTICSTNKVIKKYEDKYCTEKKINSTVLWSNQESKNDFLNTYLETIYMEARIKNNSKKIINELKKGNNKIFIITARTNKYIKQNMEELIKKYLKKKKIEVDKIIINSKDKVTMCKELKIDIMLEDNLYNYEALSKENINVVLFDELKQHQNINNRINNWSEFTKFINC